MASFNKVLLLGNLTRDPEVRYTPKGSAVADLGIAVNRSYTARKRRETRRSHLCRRDLLGTHGGNGRRVSKKGRPVFIEGRLQLDTWDDKQSGQKRSKLKVIGETMQMLGSAAWWGRRMKATKRSSPSASRRARRRAVPPGEPDDDEIPF